MQIQKKTEKKQARTHKKQVIEIKKIFFNSSVENENTQKVARKTPQWEEILGGTQL